MNSRKPDESGAIGIDQKAQVASFSRSDDLTLLLAPAEPPILIGSRLLTAEAMMLVIHLDRDLREARAQWNQDWFRRVMQARNKAVSRLLRRWAALSPPPPISLGRIRRRYHANLARCLYEVAE